MAYARGRGGGSRVSIMSLGVSDDIDGVIWVKNALIISTLFLTLIA